MSYFTLMLVPVPGTQGGPSRAALTTGQYMYQMAFEDLRLGGPPAVSLRPLRPRLPGALVHSA
jgi:hypothetical protein